MDAQLRGNFHQDALNADVGTDEASDLRLLEELKSRAKGAFAHGDMPTCDLLYSKALTIKKGSTVYSNRAMVRLNLGNYQGALDDSQACLSLDPTFVKAYYRKAMALLRLEEFDEALNVCQDASVQDNKEIQQLAGEIVLAKRKVDQLKAALREEAQDMTVDRPAPVPTRVPLMKADLAANKEPSGFRGYKTRADGATTSYFHMDISDEARKLIGDIRPQKLDAPVETGADLMSGSVWNQAGTFESRSYKKWAVDKLSSVFPLTVNVIKDSVICEVEVPSIEHDIELICNRGKKRFVNDLTFTFDWVMKKEGAQFANGNITFENDGDGDYTPFVIVDRKTDAAFQQMIDMTIKHAGSSVVHAEILKKIQELDAEFRKF